MLTQKCLLSRGRSSFKEEGSRSIISCFLNRRKGDVVSSHEISNILHNIPIVDVGYILVAPEIAENATQWLDGNREPILSGNSGE